MSSLRSCKCRRIWIESWQSTESTASSDRAKLFAWFKKFNTKLTIYIYINKVDLPICPGNFGDLYVILCDI